MSSQQSLFHHEETRNESATIFSPRVAETNWHPPREFPDLQLAREVGFDIESRDPRLKERGPGGIRRDGEIIGVSVYTDYGFKGYYPFAHKGGGNLDKGMVLKWVKTWLENPNITKIGANILYEMEWFRSYGIEVLGPLVDVQTAQCLLDEEAKSYALEALCQQYLGQSKDEKALYAAAAAHGIEKKDVKANLYQLHAKYVGPYAEFDAEAPHHIWQKQKLLLQAEELMGAFDNEMELLPIVLDMRFLGVKVDLQRAADVQGQLKKEEGKLVTASKEQFGFYMDDVWSADAIAKGADILKLRYLRTAKTDMPSFTKPWLKSQEAPYWKMLKDMRALNRLRTTFIDSAITGHHVNGRVHCQFHPTRKSDDDNDMDGTRTLRFSSTNPNMQQVPNPDGSPLAWLIRSIFAPEDGCEWYKFDYSQQEPRLAVHYSHLLKFGGAAEARQMYIDDPQQDFYLILVALAAITRPEAKKNYLAITYGMGNGKFARELGKSIDQAIDLRKKLNEKVPFLQELAKYVSGRANTHGFIKTIGGGRCHFNLWEPTKYEEDEEKRALILPCDYETAKDRWKGQPIKRAGTYKALNRLIQRGAGEMTKLAMLTARREMGKRFTPSLQVHDELDCTNLPSRKDAELVKSCMERACSLTLPIYADMKIGPNWGEAK